MVNEENYQGVCSCGNNYIDETIRNVVTRIDEHEHPNGKHLKNNPGHQFNWMILSRAPSQFLKEEFWKSISSSN